MHDELPRNLCSRLELWGSVPRSCSPLCGHGRLSCCPSTCNPVRHFPTPVPDSYQQPVGQHSKWRLAPPPVSRDRPMEFAFPSLHCERGCKSDRGRGRSSNDRGRDRDDLVAAKSAPKPDPGPGAEWRRMAPAWLLDPDRPRCSWTLTPSCQASRTSAPHQASRPHACSAPRSGDGRRGVTLSPRVEAPARRHASAGLRPLHTARHPSATHPLARSRMPLRSRSLPPSTKALRQRSEGAGSKERGQSPRANVASEGGTGPVLGAQPPVQDLGAVRPSTSCGNSGSSSCSRSSSMADRKAGPKAQAKCDRKTGTEISPKAHPKPRSETEALEQELSRMVSVRDRLLHEMQEVTEAVRSVRMALKHGPPGACPQAIRLSNPGTPVLTSDSAHSAKRSPQRDSQTSTSCTSSTSSPRPIPQPSPKPSPPRGSDPEPDAASTTENSPQGPPQLASMAAFIRHVSEPDDQPATVVPHPGSPGLQPRPLDILLGRQYIRNELEANAVLWGLRKWSAARSPHGSPAAPSHSAGSHSHSPRGNGRRVSPSSEAVASAASKPPEVARDTSLNASLGSVVQELPPSKLRCALCTAVCCLALCCIVLCQA